MEQLGNYPYGLYEPLPYHLFKKETTTENQTVADEQLSTVHEHGRAVRCAYCKSLITYQGNADTIAGKHVHSYSNPAGYEFTIACYHKAWCKITGRPTREWSWFAGYTWQYALCPQCQEHLGWFYHNQPNNSSFYGLILERIIIENENNEAQ